MAMSQAKLASQLLSLPPVPAEADAVAALAQAYAAFAADATAGAAPITPAGVALGKAAMVAALGGIGAPGAGAAVLTAAVQAFWSAVAGGLAASFATAIAIVPPPHAGLLALLSSTFASNTASAASAADATAAVAADLYSQAIVGGGVTFPGPVAAPIA